jgi:hypothetical protein
VGMVGAGLYLDHVQVSVAVITRLNSTAACE